MGSLFTGLPTVLLVIDYSNWIEWEGLGIVL